MFDHLSVFVNLELALTDDRRTLSTLFARLGVQQAARIDEVLATIGLGAVRERPAGALSHGQQQQLAIARALVTRPRLLLLDEPTEGIQPSIIKQIGDVISRLAARGDMAILLVEQYFDFARAMAHDLLVMDRGEVALAGPKSEVDEGLVRRYLTV